MGKSSSSARGGGSGSPSGGSRRKSKTMPANVMKELAAVDQGDEAEVEKLKAKIKEGQSVAYWMSEKNPDGRLVLFKPCVKLRPRLEENTVLRIYHGHHVEGGKATQFMTRCREDSV